jgi:Trk K+ transport system NAD-binding subunit
MTGALVQLFTATEIRNLLGSNRVKTEIDKLNGHIIVCGFGRIGGMVAQDLTEGGAAFLILERNDKIAAEAQRLGYLTLIGDATDEATLLAAGIARASTLATVLPDDAANVFITLSARSLNPALRIIARGEAPTTERKLVHAGANQVILPTHIGAERIAELILYPATAQMLRGSREGRAIERSLRDLGLDIEMVSASEQNQVAGLTVGELERQAAGAFMVARIERADGEQLARPAPDTPIRSGDGLVVVGRSAGAFSSLFAGTKPALGEGD